jgi:hypothetical protein
MRGMHGRLQCSGRSQSHRRRQGRVSARNRPVTVQVFQGTLHAGEATARVYAALTDAQREDVAPVCRQPDLIGQASRGQPMFDSPLRLRIMCPFRTLL